MSLPTGSSDLEGEWGTDLEGRMGQKRITTARLGEPIGYPDAYGDLWCPTWADDGNVYVALDDASGFAPWEPNYNLMIARLEGDDPSRPGEGLVGFNVNHLEEYGYGGALQEDGACWKAMGLTCIDGILYMAVSRHRYYDERMPLNHAWDGSIIKSEDHGRSWSAQPALGRAMFPGSRFSTPFFVEYGRDGESDAHDAERYVYAVANDGFWNNGSSMVLGRCEKARLPQLDGTDWEFVQAFDDDGAPLWGPRHDTARLLFRSPGRTSENGIHYVPGIGLYIMGQWHFPDLEQPGMSLNDRFKRSVFEFYQAPAPWGPWERFLVHEWDIEGYYNPSIPSKFISSDGLSMHVFTSGGFSYQEGEEHHLEYYTLTSLRLELEVKDA
jgi:hypothetical protein